MPVSPTGRIPLNHPFARPRKKRSNAPFSFFLRQFVHLRSHFERTTEVVGVTFLINGSGAPISNGQPPPGSLAFVNSVTITATGTPSGGVYSWTKSSNKITLSNTTSATVTVTGVTKSASQNDVIIQLSYKKNGVGPTVSVPITVQQPTFMGFVSSTGTSVPPTCTQTITDDCCPSGQTGVQKDMVWQVQDQFHSPMSFRLPTYDTLTNNTPNSCSNPAQGEGTAPGFATGSGGQWGHHYGECSTACVNGGQCQVTGTQAYFVNGFQINQPYTRTCTSITVDGH
jgi:hypothetical protein